MRAQSLAIAVWMGLALCASAAPQDRMPANVASQVIVPLAEQPFERLVDRDAGITPEAAWLVWDPDWRGEVRSHADMIGQRAWSIVWRDGFEALRALDRDGDGELAGAELGGLALWRDANGDGVSDPGEVLPANVHGIAALALEGRPTRPGLITAPQGVRLEDGRTRPLYDWMPMQPRCPEIASS